MVLLKRKLLVHKILRDEELNINTGLKKGEKNVMLIAGFLAVQSCFPQSNSYVDFESLTNTADSCHGRKLVVTTFVLHID